MTSPSLSVLTFSRSEEGDFSCRPECGKRRGERVQEKTRASMSLARVNRVESQGVREPRSQRFGRPFAAMNVVVRTACRKGGPVLRQTVSSENFKEPSLMVGFCLGRRERFGY